MVHDGGGLSGKQAATPDGLGADDFLTTKARRIKEKLRWVHRSETAQATRWWLSHFLRYAREQIGDSPLF